MVKNVSYALPLFGKFSRLNAMTHRYEAQESTGEKAAEHAHLKINPAYS